jgi:hypothetical protein
LILSENKGLTNRLFWKEMLQMLNCWHRYVFQLDVLTVKISLALKYLFAIIGVAQGKCLPLK